MTLEAMSLALGAPPAEPWVPQVYAYFGHHKCGTTWIRRVLNSAADALGMRYAYHDSWLVFHNEDRALDLLYAQGFVRTVAAQRIPVVSFTDARPAHADLLPAGARGFHVVRDPRDLLVSAYYSHKESHTVESFPNLAAHRMRLQTMSRDEGMLEVLDFLAPMLEDLRTWQPRAGVHEVRLEDLMLTPEATFRAIFAHLGLLERLGEEGLAAVVDAHSFARLTGGRCVGEEDPLSHWRKGVPGDWKTHFGPKLAVIFAKRYGDLVQRFGFDVPDA
jgi:hypothetical protein